MITEVLYFYPFFLIQILCECKNTKFIWNMERFFKKNQIRSITAISSYIRP